MERARRTWKARIGVTFAASLCGLALAEVVARVGTEAVPAPPRYEGELLAPSSVDKGYELVPLAELRVTLPRADGGETTVVHRVPAHGWRGAPFEPRKRPGTQRIGFVGDSHVFGWGVEDECTWPAQLARELAVDGRAVEVLNLGIPNLNLEEKVGWATERAFALDCDLVLFEMCFDDDALDGVELGRHGGFARTRALVRPGATGWLEWLRAHSRAVDVVADGLWRKLGTRAHVTQHAAGMRRGHAARRRIDAALRRLHEAAEERGIDLAAVVIPLPVRAERGWATRAIDEELVECAREAGIDTLYLDRAFETCGDAALWIHPLDLHVNALGLGAAARATAEFLCERRKTVALAGEVPAGAR